MVGTVVTVAPPGEWPLVGRARELEQLDRALARPDAAGVLLVGPAGVGKSRLAEECLRMGRRRGLRCARVRATRASSAIPLGALAPLLPRLEAGAQLRGDLLHDAVHSFGGDGDRTLVVIDDVQLLDDASALVVNQVVTAGRCFVVMTARSGVPAPEAITALWKDLDVERIDLALLTRPDVDELLRAALRGRVDGATRRDFWDASGGNALFVRELLLGAVDAEILRFDGTIWRLEQRLSSPPRLVDLVEARLGDLDQAERSALELVALGEPIDIELLADLDVDPTRLESLGRQGLLTVEHEAGGNRVRLAHPLHGDVVRQQMTAFTRMVVSRRLADVVDGRSASLADHAGDMVQRAVWRLEGGGAAAPGLMLAAARRAFFVADHHLAERLARAAVDEAPDLECGLLLAQVLEAESRHDEAEELLALLQRQAEADEPRALIGIQRAVTLVWGLDRGDDAVRVLRETAEQTAPGPWRDELEAQQVTVDVLLGRIEEAIEHGRPMVEPVQVATRAGVTAAVGMAPALSVTGRCHEAIEVADRAFAARIELGDQEILSEAGIYLVARSLALGELGRLAEATGTADAGYEGSVAGRYPLGQAWFALMRGRIALLTGRLSLAFDQFCEGAAVFGQAGRAGARRWCAAGRLMAAAMRSDRTEVDLAEAALDAMGPSSMAMMEPDVDRARAWALLARGLETDCRTQMIVAAERAADQRTWALAVSAWHDLARVGEPQRALTGLAPLVGRVDGELVRIRLRHVESLVRRDGVALMECASGFAALGAELFAAEAAAAAALQLTHAGDRAAARRAGQRADEHLARCEGARTPALTMLEAPPVLTRREREIATMAAAGLANKEIATQLVLSVRTVDAHLQSTYTKLGVSGRRDLREALPR